MHALTNELYNSYAGGISMRHVLFIIMYADAIFLLTPTDIAMQNLLDVCHTYGIANDILFNPLKSVCIVYKHKSYLVQIIISFGID